MVTTVLFKICQKEEAFERFQNFKQYLKDKEYVAVKLVKKLTLLKFFLKEGKLPSEVIYDFKCFQVSKVDFLDLEYKGYLEIDHRGFFDVKPCLNIKESVLELQKVLEANNVGLMTFQQIIHACDLPFQPKVIEISGCSSMMQDYYFKPMKQSFQTQVIDENFSIFKDSIKGQNSFGSKEQVK